MGEWIGFFWLHHANQAGWFATMAGQLCLAVIATVGSGCGTCALITLLLEAIHDEDMTILQACQEMQITQPQFHRQTTGEANNHASIQRAARLPGAVLARWGELIALQFGNPAEYERRAWLYLSLAGKQRMVKARLSAQINEAVG